MNYDSYDKRTRIPFRFVKGKFLHFDDETEITELRENCVGEIVVENFQIKDATRIALYNTEREVDFLPKGTQLLARVSERNIPAELQSQTNDEGRLIGGARVAIILEEDLRLQLRGTKRARLVDCKCRIPALPDIEETKRFSVNQAFTRISERFEPHRVSSGGNVFNDIYYKDAKLGWQPLRTLRDRRTVEES